jgi:hypothetical protein
MSNTLSTLLLAFLLFIIHANAITLNKGKNLLLTQTKSSSLVSPGTLSMGGSLVSTNGSYTLKMQTDGNLVIYYGSTAIFASNTSSSTTTNTYTLKLQSDGNLVIYKNGSTSIWESRTDGKGTGPYKMYMQDDGNLVIYDSTGSATFYTYTYGVTTSGYTLCVTAADLSESGTSNDVTLAYYKENKSSYKCKLFGGIGRGEKRCCYGANFDTTTYTNWNKLTISTGSDGLRVTELYTGDGETATQFDQKFVSGGPEMDGDLGPQNECWKRFWVDSSGHESCGTVAATMDSDSSCVNVWCDE